MAAAAWRASTLLVTLMMVSGLSKDFQSNYGTFTVEPYIADEEVMFYILLDPCINLLISRPCLLNHHCGLFL